MGAGRWLGVKRGGEVADVYPPPPPPPPPLPPPPPESVAAVAEGWEPAKSPKSKASRVTSPKVWPWMPWGPDGNEVQHDF